MDNRSYDLKDALRAGADPKVLAEDFAKQLAMAQLEVEKEQTAASNGKLDEARETAIDAILDYVIALGVTTQDEIEKVGTRDDIIEAVKEAEHEFMEAKPVLDLLRQLSKDKPKSSKKPSFDADERIARFLRTL